MANIKARLARLEAGQPDPLSKSSRFEVRRLRAEETIRQSIEALHVQQRYLFPELTTGGHTVPRIQNLKELVVVERSIEETERSLAFLLGKLLSAPVFSRLLLGSLVPSPSLASIDRLSPDYAQDQSDNCQRHPQASKGDANNGPNRLLVQESKIIHTR